MTKKTPEEMKMRIHEIEAAMMLGDFWNDKDKAQSLIAEMQELKDAQEGLGKYDKRGAHITIFAGAGGDDSEDFVRILLDMYIKYIEQKGWKFTVLHENQNDHNGYRNITFEVTGKNVYGALQNESGVHRLVRISPFNSKSQRHTSFAMVEVVPKFEKNTDFTLDEEELQIDFTKSSGPGGQNVNKRETAVRITHQPSGLQAFVSNERSQLQNREKALEILTGKVFRKQQVDEEKAQGSLYVSKTTEAEWGSQIRSYVMHPYQMVKDHRTNTEVRNIDDVLSGNIQVFIDAMKDSNNVI